MRNFIFSFCLFFLPFPIWAGGIEINYEAVRTAAMGNVGTGLCIDASSVFSNPGAMGLLYKSEFQLGMGRISSRTNFSTNYPKVYDTLSLAQVQWCPSFYAVIKPQKEGNWTLGLSVNSPYNILTQWPHKWLYRNMVETFSLRTLAIQATIAYRIRDKWGFGIGLMYYISEYYNKKLSSVAVSDEGYLSWKAKGNGMGINAGIFYKWNEKWKIGLSLRSPLKLQFQDGIATSEDKQASAPKKKWEQVGFSTQIPIAGNYRLGLSFAPKKNILLAIEGRVSDWKRWDSLHFSYKDSLFDGQKVYKKRILMTNSFSIHSGVEWHPKSCLALRGGIYFVKSMVRNNYVSPEYPDANHLGITAGIGCQIAQKFVLNLSAGYDITGERTSLYSFPKADIPAVFSLNTYYIGFNAGYKF
jgi:long-chain fatty acid transport protein